MWPVLLSNQYTLTGILKGTGGGVMIHIEQMEELRPGAPALSLQACSWLGSVWAPASELGDQSAGGGETVQLQGRGCVGPVIATGVH